MSEYTNELTVEEALQAYRELGLKPQRHTVHGDNCCVVGAIGRKIGGECPYDSFEKKYGQQYMRGILHGFDGDWSSSSYGEHERYRSGYYRGKEIAEAVFKEFATQ